MIFACGPQRSCGPQALDWQFFTLTTYLTTQTTHPPTHSNNL
jgi:hypothetical protein